VDFKGFEGKSDDGAEMTVTHPGTGEPTDAVIRLAGIDSEAWRSASHKLSDRVIKEGGGKVDVARAFERSEEHVSELVASVTISWENVKDGGPELKCTRENAKRLYMKYPWLREQVNRFAGNRANFFRSVEAAAPDRDEGADRAAAPPEGQQE
jgi:hypothetical protein